MSSQLLNEESIKIICDILKINSINEIMDMEYKDYNIEKEKFKELDILNLP